MEQKMKLLKIALVLIGVTFIAGVPLLMNFFWVSGWSWTPSQHEYEQMIMGVYATLGLFLILAAKDPMQHASLIWFTVWSSVVHGGIMLVQALVDETEHAHLMGDCCLSACLPNAEKSVSLNFYQQHKKRGAYSAPFSLYH